MINRKRGLVIAFAILAIYTLLASLVDALLIVKFLSVALATSLTCDLLGYLLYKGWFKSTMLRDYLMPRYKIDINRGFQGYDWDQSRVTQPIPTDQELHPTKPLEELTVADGTSHPLGFSDEHLQMIKENGSIDIVDVMCKTLSKELEIAVYNERKQDIIAGAPLKNEEDYEIALALIKPFADMPQDAVLSKDDDLLLDTVVDSIMVYTIENLKAQ